MSKFKAAKEAGKLFEYYFDRLLRGFRKDQGRDPENLEMILIRQTTLQGHVFHKRQAKGISSQPTATATATKATSATRPHQ